MARSWIRTLLLCVVAIGVTAPHLNAQPNRGQGDSRGGRGRMGGPELGQPLPDVQLFDALLLVRLHVRLTKHVPRTAGDRDLGLGECYVLI